MADYNFAERFKMLIFGEIATTIGFIVAAAIVSLGQGTNPYVPFTVSDIVKIWSMLSFIGEPALFLIPFEMMGNIKW